MNTTSWPVEPLRLELMRRCYRARPLRGAKFGPARPRRRRMPKPTAARRTAAHICGFVVESRLQTWAYWATSAHILLGRVIERDDDNPLESKLEIEERLDCEKPTGNSSVLSWRPGYLSFLVGGIAWQPPRSVAAIESP